MAEVIATIKLAPGVVGIYDPLTRIHLMISNPTANILAGMNTSKIAYWVKMKKVILVSGSLAAVKKEVPAEEVKPVVVPEAPAVPEVPVAPEAPVEPEKEPVPEYNEEQVPSETLNAEAPVEIKEEEVQEDPAEEVANEEAVADEAKVSKNKRSVARKNK